ncbi:hypothetical protein IWX79_003258 [Janthinobacterium sp. CAN_S1]
MLAELHDRLRKKFKAIFINCLLQTGCPLHLISLLYDDSICIHIQVHTPTTFIFCSKACAVGGLLCCLRISPSTI